MQHTIATLAQQPDLLPAVLQICQESWPAYLTEDDTRYWRYLCQTYPDDQLLMLHEEQQVIAVAQAVRFNWNKSIAGLPGTLDELMERAGADNQSGERVNSVAAVSVTIAPAYQGRGLSRRMLEAVKLRAMASKAEALVVPVRPVLKARYPLTPFGRYVTWQQGDGEPFDPWLRVHARLGARQLATAPEAVTVRASIQKWEAWTGMLFPESGRYIIEGALQPLLVNRERDEGAYVDPAVWVLHPW